MSANADAPMTQRRKVIIDTDAGCDDAIAILMALRDPTIDVIAITSVFGNVPQAQATGQKLELMGENVFTILRIFDRLDIPFYAGAAQPLVVDLDIKTWPGHGANGLGDASFHEGGEQHEHEEYLKKVQSAVGKVHAVQALIDFSLKYPGEIDLIALGPLTNLALGVRMDPLFASRFRSLTVMGASSFAKGNASMAGEFNFYCDPEGAYVALQHFPSPTLPVLIVPWETTESSSLTWSQFDELTTGHEEHISSDPNTKHRLEASFLKKTHAKYELVVRADYKEQQAKTNLQSHSAQPAKRAKSHGATSTTKDGVVEHTVTADQAEAFNEIPSVEELAAAASSSTVVGSSTSQLAVGTQSYMEDAPANYVCCDSYAVAAFLRPDVITRSATHYAEVVIQGTADTRGMLAIDWYDRKPVAAKKKRMTIVTGIDREKYYQMMKDIFQPHANSAKESSLKPGTRKRTGK